MPPWPVTSSGILWKLSAGAGEDGATPLTTGDVGRAEPRGTEGEEGAVPPCIDAERTDDEVRLDDVGGAQADMAAAPCKRTEKVSGVASGQSRRTS